MDLRKRLANLDRLTRKAAGPGSGRPPPENMAACLVELGLVTRDTPLGPVHTREYTDPLELSAAALPDFLGFFTKVPEASPTVEDLLWLDTETTGLAGGTGTLAFLVGVSWWRDDQLTTRQYFLPGPGAEAAMLAELKRLAVDFKVVLTFNGASFDLPLLRTRALMNRETEACAHLVSWDLLVPARRLFGRRLPDCRQQTVERLVFQPVRQEGDIDGALIPGTWFDFLSSGQVGRLPDVLRHNRRDMVGMGHIFREVWRQAQLSPWPADGGTSDWLTAWSLGRICESAAQRQEAIAWLTAAVRDPKLSRDGGWSRTAFVADALRILKRSGDWALVETVLARALAAGLAEPWLHREAAILYEHRLVQLERALDHAHLSDEGHRVARLRGKLEAKGKPTS